jgi:hypothetical protein
MGISCIQDLCLKRRLTAQKTDGSTNTTVHLNTFCHVKPRNLFRMAWIGVSETLPEHRR